MRSPSEGDDLIDYLEDNWEGLYGYRSLRGKEKAHEALPIGNLSWHITGQGLT